MPKTFTDLDRHALNGPTMGTRWSALFHMPRDFDPAPVAGAMAAAVAKVDAQMSTWKPDSDLMRLNAAPAGPARSISAGRQAAPSTSASATPLRHGGLALRPWTRRVSAMFLVAAAAPPMRCWNSTATKGACASMVSLSSIFQG